MVDAATAEGHQVPGLRGVLDTPGEGVWPCILRFWPSFSSHLKPLSSWSPATVATGASAHAGFILTSCMLEESVTAATCTVLHAYMSVTAATRTVLHAYMFLERPSSSSKPGGQKSWGVGCLAERFSPHLLWGVVFHTSDTWFLFK